MNSPFSPFPTEANPRAGITRCIRRICLLREQNDAAEATRVEQNEFANALRDFRLAHGPETLPESELRTLYDAEQKRVADAIILSELLIPQLVKSFPAAAASAAQVRPAAVAATAASSRDSAVPFPRAAAAAGVSPVIADLLDAMLASERGGRRPLSANG